MVLHTLKDATFLVFHIDTSILSKLSGYLFCCVGKVASNPVMLWHILLTAWTLFFQVLPYVVLVMGNTLKIQLHLEVTTRSLLYSALGYTSASKTEFVAVQDLFLLLTKKPKQQQQKQQGLLAFFCLFVLGSRNCYGDLCKRKSWSIPSLQDRFPELQVHR